MASTASSSASPSLSSSSPQPERRRAVSTATWGAACAQCAAAKTKCLRTNETQGSKCDRCERLSKKCMSQIHKQAEETKPAFVSRSSLLLAAIQGPWIVPEMRHSPWSVARLSVSQSRHSRIPNFRFRRKTSQLEERLDRLVNLLRVSDGTSALASHAETAQINTCTEPTPLVPNNTYSALPPNHPGPDLHAQNDVSSRRAIELADVCPVKIPVSYNAFVPPTCICRPEPGEAPPPPDTDENLLKVYRTVMAPQFPFVLVPEGVSAATLGATRPFLMAAIRMVSSFRSMRSMRGQMYRLLNYIADYMVLRAERSFDLLLGLVVVVAWFHHHCVAHAQLHQLISLAACLVGELGLKNSPCLPERTRLLVLRPWEMRERTNEERRVLLAVWYLSSSIALDIHAFDPLRYSRYMQQCTRELQETQEYDSDMQLICIVRIQRLCERVADLRSRDYDDEEADMVVRAPFSAHMMGFSAELNKLQAEMPPGLLHLKIRTATARLRIHEPPNIDAELLASLSKSLGSAGSGSTNALDAFYQSNAALKAWFDTWLSVPAESFCGMALPMVSHMVYGVMMLSRWAWLASRENVPSTLLQAEPVDPFRNHSNIALAAMEAAINPNARTSPASPSAAPKGSSPWQTTLPDDDLPRALAALKAQLATQPGLMLDVNGYLDRVVAQLQAVDAAYREMSVDDGEWRDNIWSLGATKVKIAQLRQARWSKMVAAQAEVGELKDRRGGGNHEGVVGQGEMQEDFLASLQMPDWDANMVWDLLGYHDRMPGDEQLWEDVSPGEQNWSSVAMGGMGGFGQLGGDMNRWM